jgi:hypothetical protein
VQGNAGNCSQPLHESIEQALGVRRLRLRAGGFGGSFQAPGSEVQAFDGGTVMRSGFDSPERQAQEDSEPDQVPWMAALSVDDRGVKSYTYFSTRLGRVNNVTPRDLHMACPHAVNRGWVLFEESTFVGNRAEKGRPIPESLIRKSVDSPMGER